ncbi:NAD-glutamate dehydrogenase [Porticoccus sp.]|uniref:NAD-glutamate dehydrogenase n=1 Tax=Porticoccus sp. TaxID=2024853 RepID=UPI003F69A11B
MQRISEGDFFACLEAQLIEKYPAALAEQLVPFSRKIFDLFPLHELAHEKLDDIQGFVFSLFNFIRKVMPDQPAVRVFNPVLEEDGWVSDATALFIMQRDMPFLVDSVRIQLNRAGLNIQLIKSTVFQVVRDQKGVLLDLFANPKTPGCRAEALIYIDVDLRTSNEEHQLLERDILDVLRDVEVVTDDFLPMAERLNQVIAEVRENHANLPACDADELAAFLEWLRDGAFIFQGCSEFRLMKGRGAPALKHLPDKQLGIFRRHQIRPEKTALSELSAGIQAFYACDAPMAFTKSSLRSRVHRQAYSDFIVLKRYDKKGAVIGEYLFMGLYTSAVYNVSPLKIPLIRQRIEQVLKRTGFSPGSHDFKAISQLIEVHPRDELFHSSADELYDTLVGIWQISERRMVRLFIRVDPFEKFVNCLVYMPRDIYRTSIRTEIEHMLKCEFDATECEFNTSFSESLLARTQFVLRVNSNRYREVDRDELTARIIELTLDWNDELEQEALDQWGESLGRDMARIYRDAFSASYMDHFDHRSAIHDIQLFHELGSDAEIATGFYQQAGADQNVMRFKLFHRHEQLELSSLVPMLENLGFRVLGEHPYQITPRQGGEIWLHDFTLRFGLDVDVDVSQVRNTFQDAFKAVWSQQTENDRFNHLVVGARLDWRMVSLFRLYARYMKQLGSNFSQDFIADTLAANLEITRNLVALFRCLFDPKVVTPQSEEYGRAERLNQKILDALDQVSNLNEDKVLRSYQQLINATKRTNYFQLTAEGEQKPYIAVKLAPREIVDVPEPRPLYEIFVYCPRMEGVHLRTGKVARGGLRWSDRLEDYRTEILGLVKAQQVKNAVIVPTGAKGGFVAKQVPRNAGRDELLQEGIACYRLFVSGLLDLTDNVVGDEIVPPPCVVRRDDDDPYLVVAADKGTTTFSDYANELSLAYDHWLGDAFASGGSHGYDHKKMGITARGAWVSVQRHFRELGLNTQTEDFSVIGIGDMAGDVFGNGLLMSRHIKLMAAFNHQHIFIDPDPDPDTGFSERERLFHLPRSSWDDYDKTLISPGGGVFSRSAKILKLTPEIQAALAINETALKPSELINALLKAPVDLIWNGGIGSYVKGSSESHQEVGDRANDAVRVDGRELRCRVFGEGGNLGMTQRGRIEYALNGGACNTDFIDNSAGVDCSDHEVNIKILLNGLVQSQDLTVKQRNQLLVEMTEEVSELVLANNYRQTLAISLAHFRCKNNFSEYWRAITDWEANGLINRPLEYLPDDETLKEREKRQLGLTHPELAVLVSYAKILIKDQVLKSNALEDPYIAKMIAGAFPRSLSENYRDRLLQHSLKREIIANQLVNEMVNLMGVPYFQRQVASTGASVDDVMRAFAVVRDLLRIDHFWKRVESLDYLVPAEVQFELFYALMRMGRRASRWVLRNRRSCINPQQEVQALRPRLVELQLLLPTLFLREEANEWQEEVQRLVELGVQEDVAMLVSSANFLFFGFGIADLAAASRKPVGLVLELYFRLGTELDIDWFGEQIIHLEPANRWQDFARESYMDDLEGQRRVLSGALLAEVESLADIDAAIQAWKVSHAHLIARWMDMMDELHRAPGRDFAMFSVALRELLDLVQATVNHRETAPFCPI